MNEVVEGLLLQIYGGFGLSDPVINVCMARRLSNAKGGLWKECLL